MDPEDLEWDFDDWQWFDGINTIDICIHFNRARYGKQRGTLRS